MPENYTGKNEKSKGIQAADAAPASFILPVFVVVGGSGVFGPLAAFGTCCGLPVLGLGVVRFSVSPALPYKVGRMGANGKA